MNRLVALSWHIHEPLSGLVMIPKAGFYPRFFPKSPRPVPFEDQMISLDQFPIELHPLTQLRVRLGFASPTLLNPLPQLGPHFGGRGKGEGLFAHRSCSIENRASVRFERK
jgi:hypothetical protein